MRYERAMARYQSDTAEANAVAAAMVAGEVNAVPEN